MTPKFYRKYDYPKRLLPNGFVATLEAKVHDLESAKLHTGKSVGYPGWNLLYYCCLCSLNPAKNNLIVETGTNQGMSTIMLAQALKDSGGGGAVITIEVDNKAYAIANENFKRAGLDNHIRSYLGDSKEVLADVVKSNGDFDFVFLDGDHRMNHVLNEFSIVHDSIIAGGKVFFDNTDYVGQEKDLLVYGALKEIEKKYSGQIVRFPYCSWYTPGQAIWQKN